MSASRQLALLMVSGVPLSARWPAGIPPGTPLFAQAWQFGAGGGFGSSGTLAIVAQ